MFLRIDYHQSSRFSKKLMVSAGVCWEGKTRLHIINMNEKINSNSYINLLKNSLIPDCKLLYPENDFIFMQDGASSHTSRVTQDFLKNNVPSFIDKDQWPPQSADLNPMDYSIWEILKKNLLRVQT